MKKNNKKINLAIEEGNEVSKLIKVIISVLVVFLIFLGITYFITKKEELKDNPNNSVSIQYDKILIGQILNRTDKNYYVLIAKGDDSYLELYSAYISEYKGKDNALKVFNVDLNEGLNVPYIAETSQLSVSNASDFKFKDVTLLKIKDNKVEKAIETKDKIIEYFEELNK